MPGSRATPRLARWAGKAHWAKNVRCPNIWTGSRKQALLEALEQTGFNRNGAAKLLGLTFRTMRYRMERLASRIRRGR